MLTASRGSGFRGCALEEDDCDMQMNMGLFDLPAMGGASYNMMDIDEYSYEKESMIELNCKSDSATRGMP